MSNPRFAIPPKVAGMADAVTRALLPLAVYGMGVCFVDLADWRLGILRATGLAVIAWGLFALMRRPLPPSSQSVVWAVLIILLALLKLVPGLAAAGKDFGKGPNDIGYTTAAAVEVLDNGGSIYATPIDKQGDIKGANSGFRFFYGYKYGPVTPLYYSEFLRLFGYPKGLYFGNVLLLLLAAPLAAALAAGVLGGFRRAPLAAAVAFFCVVFPRFTYFELFSQGVNDLLPTVLIAASLYLATRGNAFFCGVAAGLSLACKPLPGALYLLLLPGTVRALPLLAGCGIGLGAMLPDFIRAPREMIANLILFNLYRQDDNTGLAYFLPEHVRPLVSMAALLLVGAVAYAYHTGKHDGAALVGSAALLATVFLATGKVDHRNYFLWWTPLLGPALAVTCYRPEKVGGHSSVAIETP